MNERRKENEEKRGEDVAFLLAEKVAGVNPRSAVRSEALKSGQKARCQSDGSVGGKWDGKLNEIKWLERPYCASSYSFFSIFFKKNINYIVGSLFRNYCGFCECSFFLMNSSSL